jgi:hypothetical protein
MTGARTAALAAFVGMAARLFGDVVLEPPVELGTNWWGARDTTALLTALEPVRPRPAALASRDVIVTFGDRVGAGSFGVGGDDYTVRLGRAPQPLGSAPTHAFGVHAAACLAVSQLLIQTLGPHGFSGVAIDGAPSANVTTAGATPVPRPPPG